MLDGSARMFYESGRLKNECLYQSGVKEGQCIFYYASGHLIKKVSGCQAGSMGQPGNTMESGSIKAEQTYRDDLLEGEGPLFYPSGNLQTEYS